MNLLNASAVGKKLQRSTISSELTLVGAIGINNSEYFVNKLFKKTKN